MKKKDDEEDELKIKDESDFLSLIPECDGMFDNRIKPRKFLQNKTKYLIYKTIITIILFGFQLYSFLYPYLLGEFSLLQFFAYLIIRLIFLKRICSYNFIDICINWPKVIKLLKKKSYRLILYIMLVLYAVLFVAFIVFYIIVSKINIFPTIDNAFYIENNEDWLKYNNLLVTSDAFCLKSAHNNGSLKTDDFAMMTTLPRLYDINKENKCYLKPSKRGLFNSTYIFGKDYEYDGIQIMCKIIEHNLYLVITSEKILNETLQDFKHQNYKLLSKQFNIKNSDYFEHLDKEKLNEKSKFLYNLYEECLSQNNRNCDKEWDVFTQYYWPNTFSDEYVNIPGFESYQINIDSDMIIQPSFITDDGKSWPGTHYIVGGGYENKWNFGFFIETFGKKYIPMLIENFLPMYSFIRDIKGDILIRLDWLNKHVFYMDDFTTKEMKSLSELYNQVNFSHQSLFAIGHSISGTALKVISLLTDVQGIVFEASDSETNMNFLDKLHLTKLSESESLITNIYSDGTIFTGFDEKCNINGILPKRYLLPNVYDTACLTAISCSNTMKYVPFCQQVLAQNKQDPMKEYNIPFDAYLKHYGYI